MFFVVLGWVFLIAGIVCGIKDIKNGTGNGDFYDTPYYYD